MDGMFPIYVAANRQILTGLKMRRELIAALSFGMSFVTVSVTTAKEADFSAPHSWRYERNKICLSSHSHHGYGNGKSKRAALKAAIKEWHEFTNWEYGRAWSSYNKASGKIVSYTKAAVGWSASIEARPCRLKPRRTKRSRRR